MNLHELGWTSFFEKPFIGLQAVDYLPARVAEEHKELYRVFGEFGALTAEVSGRLRHRAQWRSDFPSVGDWVAITAPVDDGRAVIHTVLPRKSKFSRKAVLAGGPKYGPGKTDEQVLAANIDTVFLVCGLDGDFNIRRLERYTAAAWDSGANPVIILNKADLCDTVEERLAEVEAVAIGVPIHAISAITNEGLDVFREYLGPGATGAFLGSSGVGKSTIINSLLGEERLKTQAVREYDSRGRHTTTFRQMILLSAGGILIDTPGMREIQMWGDEGAISQTFEDIEELASACRFGDCLHRDEPGCAIRKALDEGRLEADRYGNYLKMLKELRHLARRKNTALRRREHRERDRRYRQYHKGIQRLKNEGIL